MTTIEHMRSVASTYGLTVEHYGLGHYQIRGGAGVVNYWPDSKRRTAHVEGTYRSTKITHATIHDACKLAQKPVAAKDVVPQATVQKHTEEAQQPEAYKSPDYFGASVETQAEAYARGFEECRDKCLHIVDEHDGYLARITDIDCPAYGEEDGN